MIYVMFYNNISCEKMSESLWKRK